MLDKLKGLVSNKRIVIPVFVTMLLAYGFYLCHETIYIDDTAIGDYVVRKEMLNQGRWGYWILMKAAGFTEIVPFGDKLFTLAGLLTGVFVIMALAKRHSDDKISDVWLCFFSCLFLSYSLFNEFMFYAGTIWPIMLKCSMVGLAIWIYWPDSAWGGVKRWVTACMLLAMAIATYEVSAAIYIELAIFLMLLEHRFQNKYVKIWDIVKKGIPMAVLLAVSIFLQRICAVLFCRIAGLPVGGRRSLWNIGTFAEQLKKIFVQLTAKYAIGAIWYFPMAEVLIASVVCLVFIIISLKKRNWVGGGLYFLLALSSIAMHLFLGELANNRTIWEILAIFCGIIFADLLICLLRYKPGCAAEIWRKALYVGAVLLIYAQCMDLNKWEYINYLRDIEERHVLCAMGDELQINYDVESKPVVFVGKYMITSDVIRRNIWMGADKKKYDLSVRWRERLGATYWGFNETGCTSVLAWAVDAFGTVNRELLDYFELNGYSFIQGTKEMYDTEKTNIDSIAVWPAEGSIIDRGDYIVVRIGK